VTIGARPEDMTVGSASNSGIPVKVDVVEELGADGYLYGHTDDDARVDFVVRVDGRAHPEAGDTVRLTPLPDRIHVFDAGSGARLEAA
jgi:multiple sugar transport system ATP-binding protein